MNSVSKLKVLIAHDEPLIAAGLQATLLNQHDFDVSTTAPSLNGKSAVSDERIDVILADCRTGIRLAQAERSTRQAPARPSIVIVTQDESEVSIRGAMESGVRGYLFLGATAHSVAQAVRCAACGGIALDPLATTKMLDSLKADTITSRELQVLSLMTLGLPNKAIAARLGITLGTVKCHVKRLLNKLDAKTRTEAAAIAQRRGLLTAQNCSERRDADRPALRARLKAWALTTQSAGA